MSITRLRPAIPSLAALAWLAGAAASPAPQSKGAPSSLDELAQQPLARIDGELRLMPPKVRELVAAP